MSNIIDLRAVEDNEIALRAFKNANRFIIDKYNPSVLTEHRRNWEREFNVKIGRCLGSGQWISLEFTTPQELTWFLLRWS